MRRLIVAMAILGAAHSAHAHGIAGNRFFPGTLSFDDPAVADESILPLFSSSKHPDEGGNVVDNRFSPRGQKTVATMNPRPILRSGELASGGRSDRAAQRRSRTFYRCQGAAAFISR